MVFKIHVQCEDCDSTFWLTLEEIKDGFCIYCHQKEKHEIETPVHKEG